MIDKANYLDADSATFTLDGGEPTFDRARLDAVAASGLHSDPRLQFDRITQLASEIVGVPIALVSIVDDSRQFFASQCGLDAATAEARQTPLSHSVCRSVVDSGEPLVIDDLGADPRFRDHPARKDLGVEAYCGVPIRDPSGEVLGSLCLIDRKPRIWTPANVLLLSNLSALVTETLTVQRSYVNLVRQTQERLLPTTLAQPAIGEVRGLYRSVPGTSAIGGDFFDVRPRPDGGVDILVGDAVGHGMDSANAASQLRSAAIGVLSDLSLDPGDVVAKMSRLASSLPGCFGASLTIARINPVASHITWSRAGSLPPVSNQSEGALKWDRDQNPPLGVPGRRSNAETTMSMHSGDQILFFTDGLVEQRDEDLNVGLLRLWEACRIERSLDELVNRVCPAASQKDDLAVVTWVR